MGFRRLSPPILFALFLAACASPYVYIPYEFDRTSPLFAKEPEDIDQVTICYGRWGTTPEQVRAMAEKECGRFRKSARFTGQDYGTCALLAPVAAHFSCAAQ